MHRFRVRRALLWVGAAAGLSAAGCSPDDPNQLDQMQEGVVKISDHAFRVWVADTPEVRTRGLMFVEKEEMAPLSDGTPRGMLFIWTQDQPRAQGFWMRNTVIPLDIAFIRDNGEIITIRTMAPLDERLYYSEAPFRYALEVNAHVFSDLGIRKGDHVEIPESVLKQSR
jgi:uncharacterized membrane protein (UPF0127 family)